MSNRVFKRAALLVSALMLVVLGFALGNALFPSTAAPAEVHIKTSQVAAPVSETEKLYADIYNHVSPSVVAINVSGTQNGQGFEASGTGFVIDQQGHIVTNNHVVDGADLIEVNFFDGTIVQGTVVGVDPDSDLGVLKVDVASDKLVPVTLADSDKLFIGQTTLAIGGPFGERWTLTTGIVSALNRTIQGLSNYQIGGVIQTDAAINPGNSGGPLLNLAGEVIGVNSQIESGTRSNSGVGFAIPANLVKKVANDLITNGRVAYSYMGIGAYPTSDHRDITLSLIQALKLPNNIQGVVVSEVSPGSPAEKAGLRSASRPVTINGEQVPSSADVITAIDGNPINGMASLIAYLASNTRPGQTIQLSVWRDGQMITTPLTLGSRPSGQQ
jgi:2-alkenal reductase